MGFDLDLLVSTSETRPTPEELKQQVAALSPNIEFSEGGARGALWSAEYINPETLVSFDFVCKAPGSGVINFCAYETGLSVSVPCVCPSFIARESLPILAQFCKNTKYWVYTPNGQVIEKPDGAQLQVLWNEQNKRTIHRMSMGDDELPHYFPPEQMDAMWSYANARSQLTKRYNGRGIYVPRIVLLRNKLSRQQIFRSIFWTEMEPTVLPDIDAVVLSKPGKLIFGRFPAGEAENVVVRFSQIEDIIGPYIKTAVRPFEHRIVEDTASFRLPVMRRLMEILPGKHRNFETVDPEEVIDIQV
ncbi:MAG: hypothetical protein ACI38Q_05240 [Candidatus Bruticola sp.]